MKISPGIIVHRFETNAIFERAVRRKKERTSAVLLTKNGGFIPRSVTVV